MTSEQTEELMPVPESGSADWMIEPGDVLLIRVPSEFSAQAANEMRDMVMRAMPKLKDCVIVPADETRIYRERTDDPA